jgi:transposase
MGKGITVGLDIAKHVFQVHGVDVEGAVVFRRKLKRSEVLDFFDKIPGSDFKLAGWLRYTRPSSRCR